MSIQHHFSQERSAGMMAINKLPEPGLSCEYVLEGFTQYKTKKCGGNGSDSGWSEPRLFCFQNF